MALIVVLNIGLSLLIVAAIVILHARAIVAGRRDHHRPVAPIAREPEPVRPIRPEHRYRHAPVVAGTAEPREPAAA